MPKLFDDNDHRNQARMIIASIILHAFTVQGKVDSSIPEAFNRAEQFVAEAERRYGQA